MIYTLRNKRIQFFVRNGLILLLAIICCTCKSSKNKSSITSWKYNDNKWGSFNRKDYGEQDTPEGHALVEGGTFVMGLTGGYTEGQAPSRRVTVSSFYLKKEEVTNKEYREFVHWVKDSIMHARLGHFFPPDSIGLKRLDWSSPIDRTALALETLFIIDETKIKKWDVAQLVYKDIPIYPDTLVWEKDFPERYDEQWAKHYFWHPQYDDYPVVGVTFEQAEAYCDWKTMELNKVRKREGLNLLPMLRLPTEAEWEYAALSLVENKRSERYSRISDYKLFPWGSNFLNPKKKNHELSFNCNSGGIWDAKHQQMIIDYDMDGYLFTAPVKSYEPDNNDLYQMVGNVSEWVVDEIQLSGATSYYSLYEERVNLYEQAMELYRRTKSEFYGEPIEEKKVEIKPEPELGLELNRIDPNGNPIRDNSKPLDDIVAKRLTFETRLPEGYSDEPFERAFWENANREVFNSLINKNQFNSSVPITVLQALSIRGITSLEELPQLTTNFFFDNKDGQRYVKGGSWFDPPYYATPGTSKSENPNVARAYIGFRTAMIRVGSPGFYNNKKNSKKKKKK